MTEAFNPAGEEFDEKGLVRAITGTVLYAAEGKLAPEDIPQILASGDRTLAGPTVPPGGLYMTKVWYEDERLNGETAI